MKRIALAIALAAIARPVWAKGDKAKKPDVEESTDDSSDDSSDEPDDAEKPKDKKPKVADEDDKPAKAEDEPKKQDLSGHDLGTNKKVTAFEKDRFFVDKVDTEKTEDATLIQGSLTASTFLYTETGGAYTPPAAAIDLGSNAGPSRMFGDLRLQTDFRHIKASRWEARVDGRIRVVNSIDPGTNGANTQVNHIQAGLTGTNEYDIREAWLVRNGVRSDVFLGRQYIPDLGGLKLDGLRIDYAQSSKFTLLGFGGLYPLRGSRSITTDYRTLNPATNQKAPFVAAGGFGAAYRTLNSYGAIGGVVLAPFSQEQARIYATSTGYLRSGPKLDLYHFALIDLVSSYGFQITNLSAGVNYKPNQRLRLTGSFNRVDTETLTVQANAFLNAPDSAGGGATAIQNEAYIQRIATNQVRGGVSAGLGQMQRFELSTALTYRLRPAFTLTGPPVPTGMTQVVINLPAASSVEVWAALIDRHSIKDARIGIDVSQTFSTGTIAYQRSNTFGLRVSVAHDIKDGRGEWEGEVAYSKTTDATVGNMMACGTTVVGANTFADVSNCFGGSAGSILSIGGQLFYRINSNWLGLGSLYVSQINNQARSADGKTIITDPSVTSITGFARLAYRF